VSTPRTAAVPPSSSHPSLISWAPSLDPLTTSCSRAAGRGRGDLGGLGFSKRMKVECGSIWGILAVLGRLHIESTVFTRRYRGVK
jgi:hypothetical protein